MLNKILIGVSIAIISMSIVAAAKSVVDVNVLEERVSSMRESIDRIENNTKWIMENLNK